MSPDPHNDELRREREEVSAAFRAAGFDDEPSPAVDAAILAVAKDRTTRVRGYLPALAMAATVVLAVGLVLRLAVPPRNPTPISDAPQAERAPSTFESEATVGRGVADGVAEEAPLPSVATPESIVPAPAAEPATLRRRAVEELRAPSTAREPDVQSQAAATAAPSTACTTESVAQPAAWLACIAALLDAGDAPAARIELERFVATFPDYAVPEAISSGAAP